MILSFYKLAITPTCSISRPSPFSSKSLLKSPHTVELKGTLPKHTQNPHVSRKQSIIESSLHVIVQPSVSLPLDLPRPSLFPHLSHHHERPCLIKFSPWSTYVRARPPKETKATWNISFDISASWLLTELLLHHMLNNPFGWLSRAPSPMASDLSSWDLLVLKLSMGPSTLDSIAPLEPS